MRKKQEKKSSFDNYLYKLAKEKAQSSELQEKDESKPMNIKSSEC